MNERGRQLSATIGSARSVLPAGASYAYLGKAPTAPTPRTTR